MHASVDRNTLDRMIAKHGRVLDAEGLAKVQRSDPNAFLPSAQHNYLGDFEPVTSDEGFLSIETVAFVSGLLGATDRRHDDDETGSCARLDLA